MDKVRTLSARNIQQVSRPNIYEYQDFRLFLKDWFQYLGSIDSDFSLRSFSSKAGLSNALFTLILKGKRPLSSKSAAAFFPLLGLSSQETDFLHLLVAVSDAKDDEQREDALKEINSIRKFRSFNPDEFEAIEFMSKWYYVAIKEMVCFEHFKADPEWIQPRLKEKVTIKEIKKALRFLEERGFIAFHEDGTAYLPKKILDCKGGVYDAALPKFYKHMMDQAKHSIDSDNQEEVKQISNTAALTKENFSAAQEIIEEARRKINELEVDQESSADSIYYLNFSLFPLARNK